MLHSHTNWNVELLKSRRLRRRCCMWGSGADSDAGAGVGVNDDN